MVKRRCTGRITGAAPMTPDSCKCVRQTPSTPLVVFVLVAGCSRFSQGQRVSSGVCLITAGIECAVLAFSA